MGLRDELEPRRLQALCYLKVLKDQLDAETWAELQELLDDPTITNVSLDRLAKRKGWNVAASTFSRHRKGECKCDQGDNK